MTGDGNTQPVEGALSLSDLADSMDEGPDEQEEVADLAEDEPADTEETEEEEQDEEASEDDDQEETTVTLKHDGKEVTLKQSEVVELAQKGFDYSQKTMALANERKEVETVKGEVTQIREREQQSLDRAAAQLEALGGFLEAQVGAPPPIALAQQDAATYLAQKELYEARKGQLQQVKEAADATVQEAQRKRQALLNEQANATEKALKDTLPGWNDELMNDLATYLGKSGISPNTSIEAFINEGVWKLAAKAKAYDAILAKKAELKPKTELPRVQKPSAGARQPNHADVKQKEALKRFHAKPTLETLADLGDF